MFDLTVPFERDLTRVWVVNADGTYSGQGFLEWHPASGARIRAIINTKPADRRSNLVLTSGYQMFRRRIIRFQFSHHGFGWAPAYDVDDELGFAATERIDVTTDRLVLRTESTRPRADSRYWIGSASYHVRDDLSLPKSVRTDVSLDGEVVSWATALNGITVDGPNGMFMRGRIANLGSLEVMWHLPKLNFSRGDDWRWGMAFQRAMFALTSKEIFYRERRATRGARVYAEARCRTGIPKRLLCPILTRSGGGIDEDWLVRLVMLLSSRAKEGFAGRHLLDQLGEANRQVVWYGRELLTATCLEAMMRVLTKRPFVPGEGNWNFEPALRQFCRDHLGSSWDQVVPKIMACQKRLRHRNAHPDWRFESDGDATLEEHEAAMADVAALTRFFGFVLLGLAGVRDLAPDEVAELLNGCPEPSRAP